MTFTSHIIPQPSLTFFDEEKNVLCPDIWEKLRLGLWVDYSIDNQLWNDCLGSTEQVHRRPVFPRIWPIYQGFKWDCSHNGLMEDIYYPDIVPMDKNTFLDRCEKYFSQFDGKRLGVHLSGGLDSSLIIGLLHYFNISFYLFGIITDRFEFRTERRIQEILAPLGVRTEFVKIEDYPFYSGLDRIPAKQIPDGNIKAYESAKAIARACRKNGVEVVFGGQGGDSLFVDAIPLPPSRIGFNIGNEFDVAEERELIYEPEGVEIKSFYSDKSIIEGIYNLRLGEKEDATKMWARNFFKDFLPRELVDHNYTADFLGLSLSGLEAAKPIVKRLFEQAYDLLKHPIFSFESIREMMETKVFRFDYNRYINYCSRISIASWLNSLFEGV